MALGVGVQRGTSGASDGESVSRWLLVGSCLMAPLFEQNLLGLRNIPRQFFLQVYQTFLHIGETRYCWLLSFLTSAPSRRHLFCLTGALGSSAVPS